MSCLLDTIDKKSFACVFHRPSPRLSTVYHYLNTPTSLDPYPLWCAKMLAITGRLKVKCQSLLKHAHNEDPRDDHVKVFFDWSNCWWEVGGGSGLSKLWKQNTIAEFLILDVHERPTLIIYMLILHMYGTLCSNTHQQKLMFIPHARSSKIHTFYLLLTPITSKCITIFSIMTFMM